MPIDFAALLSRTPEQQEADRAAAKAAYAAQAAAAREAEIKTTIEGVLAGPAEMRHQMDGTVVVRLLIEEVARGKPATALWEPATRKEGEDFLDLPAVEAMDDAVRDGTGPRLRLHGCWRKRSWKQPSGSWASAFEFRTIRVEVLG